VVSSVNGDTSEWGSTATFTVRLNSQPTADVSVGVSSSDTGEITISPISLTFTSTDWDTDQTVTVTGINDSVADGDQNVTAALAPATSSDLNYENLNPNDASVTNIDNDRIPDTGQTTSYTTTFGEDSDYSIHPPSYSDNADGTVTDKVTGLMWQQQDDNTMYTFNDAIGYCTNLGLAGHSDWRLPSIKEITGILIHEYQDPAINVAYFPNTNAHSYWTSTPLASDTNFVLIPDFYSGSVNTENVANTTYVRCVRGLQEDNNNFFDNGNGSVTDNSTGLIWQQDHENPLNWESAISFCENLSLSGQSDWRMPSSKELQSLVDYSRSTLAINTTFFPTAINDSYWTSTNAGTSPSGAWTVGFSDGRIGMRFKTNIAVFRCVRGGE